MLLPFKKSGLLFIVVSLWLSWVPVQSQGQVVDAILAEMTLEQKVGQMFMVSFFGAPMNVPARDLISTWQPGAVVFLPSNIGTPDAITRLTNDIQQTLVDSGGYPAFIAVDQEGGIIARLKDGFTEWPVPTLLTATQDSDISQRFGAALATELRAVGINMNLAPVADLLTNRDNVVIGRRSFGSEPELVANTVSDVIRGMQSMGVLATAKHFPGHGDTADDSHVTLPTIDLTREQLGSRELMPFRAAIEANVGAMMVAHIYYSDLENGGTVPASLSESVVSGLLRDEQAYEGIIMPDALDMDAVDTVYSPVEASIGAIEAGHDLILVGAHVSPDAQISAMQAVVDAVRAGEISEERIHASARRVLLAKQKMGILDWQPLDPNTVNDRIPLEAHQQLIEEMFTAGITLVRDDAGQIPLSGNVAFIYPGSRFALWQECNQPGWQPVSISDTPSNDQISSARAAANQADTVVVFTQNAIENPQQQSLVNSLPPEKTLVVALWSPFDALIFPENLSSYMLTYSPLRQSTTAICNILNGIAPARGTLAVSLD